MHQYATQFDSPESTVAYRTLNGANDPISKLTLQEHGERVALWHRALTLHYHVIYGTFTGINTARFQGDPCNQNELSAWHFRHALLGSVGRSSKSALDFTLIAYYTQAAAMIRVVVESFVQAAYLGLEPSKSEHWRRSEDRNLRTAIPKFERMVARLDRSPMHSWAVANARVIFDSASEGSHPSNLLLRTHRGEERGEIQSYRYVPDFDPSLSRSVMSWGIFATMLGIWELTTTLERQPTPFHDDWRQLLAGLSEWFPEMITN